MEKNIASKKLVTPYRMLDFDVQDDNDGDLFVYDDGEKCINERHLNISKEKIPAIGTEFNCEESAYKFYNDYAKVAGFSIRRSVAHNDKGNILDRIFCCSCQGKRGTDKRDVIVKSHRPETRTDCLVMMKIDARQTGKYKIVKFVATHRGHSLASPSKSHMMRSHRAITVTRSLETDIIDSSGIAPRAGFELLSKQMGGRENVGFCFVDYKNYLGTKRRVEMRKGIPEGYLNICKIGNCKILISSTLSKLMEMT